MGRFERDSDGNVTNPPIIAEYERKIADAQASADQALVDQLSEEYADARNDLIERVERAEREEGQEREVNEAFDADADAPANPAAGVDDGDATQTGNPPETETRVNRNA